METNIRRFLTNQFFPYKLTENKYFVEISEKNVKLTLPSKTLLERFYEENMSEKLSKRFSIVEKWDFSYSEEIDKEDFFRNQEENENVTYSGYGYYDGNIDGDIRINSNFDYLSVKN